MKKQKFMKLSAFTSDPDLGNSFSAPATHDGEVSVVFRGKDVSIHGWDGSTWTTIYTWNSLDKQFTFNNTYQNYFLKSLTGSQETMGVSFFSTSRYQGSTPSMAGIDRDVKLHDIDEVPVYTASDVNKMLTIMSDGSLAWLLANESFTVESEGGEESSPSEIAGTFLEELSSFNPSSYGSLTDGIYTNSHSGQGSFGRLNLADENIVSFTNGEPTHEEFTVSFWTYLENSQDAGNVNLAGAGWGIVNGEDRRLMFGLGNANGGTSQHFRVYLNSNFATTYMDAASILGGWTHVALVCKSDGSQLVVDSYLNGNKLSGHIGTAPTKPLGTKLLPPESNTRWGLGGNWLSGKTIKGKIDSMQIKEAVALTDAQVAAIAAQADRQMSIETAATLGESSGPILWEDKFTLGGDASLYDDGDAGNVMRTNSTGFAHSTYDEFLSADDPDQMIASFWFKCNDQPSNTIRRDLFGSRDGFKGVMAKLIGDGASIKLKSTYSSGQYTNPPPSKNYTINLQRNVWYNVVITLDKIAGFARTYLNGTMVSEKSVTSTANWVAGGYTGGFALGSTKVSNDNSATYEIFDFDSFQMTDGFALTDSQIASIYNDGSNREVVIASDM